MINNLNKISLQEDLKELSVFLGNNLDLVQGAGGNTSVKDNDVLCVKACSISKHIWFIKGIV